ncbi:MAG: DNA repair protein RecO C-terminal domain-containing protein [Evtepia gabavorous]
MTSKELWALFLQTGLPEIYCLARRRARQEAKQAAERGRDHAPDHPGNRPAETNYKEADKILTVLTRDSGQAHGEGPGLPAEEQQAYRGQPAAGVLLSSPCPSGGSLPPSPRPTPWNSSGRCARTWRPWLWPPILPRWREASAQEGETCPELLSLLLNCLYALDTLKKPRALVKAVFELRLLCLTGYEPLLDACAVCGAPEPPGPAASLPGGALLRRLPGAAGGGVSMPLSPGPWRRPGTLSRARPRSSSPLPWRRRASGGWGRPRRPF